MQRGRRDGEIILSVPRGSRASPTESGSSHILSFSPSSHLGNGNLYLQTVGAGGEREILKSSPPLPHPLPFLGLARAPSRCLPYAPLRTLHQRECITRPLGFCMPPPPPAFFTSPALERVSERAYPTPPSPLLVCLHSTAAGDTRLEKHRFFWILTLVCSSQKDTVQ